MMDAIDKNLEAELETARMMVESADVNVILFGVYYRRDGKGAVYRSVSPAMTRSEALATAAELRIEAERIELKAWGR